MQDWKHSTPSILFYYPSIGSNLDSLGGSARVTITNALALKRRFPELHVAVSGDNIQHTFDFQEVPFVSSSQVISNKAVLESIRAIVFSTHLGPFQQLKPEPNQYWFLDSHCWHLETDILANLERFSAVFARSELHREHLSKQTCNKCRLCVVTNGLDKVVERGAPNIDRIPHSIMFSGAIVAHKRVHILIEAFLNLLPEVPNASLHLYGGASLWLDSGYYENKLRDLNIPNIFFHGVRRLDEMAALYQKHDILCSPSDLESFGMSSVEAQAHGCIPVLHDSGGARATIIEGRTGFLYSPNNSETLSIALRRALSESPHMRKSAQEFARATFSLERTVVQLSEALSAYLPTLGKEQPASLVRIDPLALI